MVFWTVYDLRVMSVFMLEGLLTNRTDEVLCVERFRFCKE